MAQTKLNYNQIDDAVINVKDYGAKGDGTDQATEIQAAIDIAEAAGGGVVFFPAGDYRVSVTKGTNDKYGIKIDSDNVKLAGEKGAKLRRLSSDISTDALAFPILLVGAPDSNSTAVNNIEITGLEFVGEDTRHSTTGSAIFDARSAIWLKNAHGVSIHDNQFTSIDSSAIYAQHPRMRDVENSQWYNTTKCSNIRITDNDFIADSHSTVTRALLHCITVRADNVTINDNYFEWCDVCVNCDTTYDDYDSLSTATYTDSQLGVVLRSGRGYVINNNNIYNSSEHCFYIDAMSVSVSGNTVIVDDESICNSNQFQIRGRGVTVTGNTLTGVNRGIFVNTGSMDVSVTGNTIQGVGDSSGGQIDITSFNLTTYIDDRSDYFATYKPMQNIVVTDNTINMPDSSQTNGVGIRIYTDVTDANFPDGQMINVIIKGNIINRPKKGILHIGNMAKNVQISNNVLNGKSFTEAGFTTGTTMDSLFALGVDDALTTPLTETSFDNNHVYGFEYILYDDGGAGGAGTMFPPYGVRGNTMKYIKYWDTAAYRSPSFESRFSENYGYYFLDRTGWYSNTAINNSMSDGTSNSEKKTCIQLVSSSDVRIYHDDAGGFKAL